MSAPLSVPALIRQTAEYLARGADPATARLDAELLAAHAAGIDRERLILHPPSALNVDILMTLAARRAAGEPLSQITGQAEFWSLPLKVTADVLSPRADSEALIALALEIRRRPPATILDFGTGSGCLLLAALSEFQRAAGLGIDRSAEAVAVAAENARALALHRRASFLIGDWSALTEGAFDLILCNPPYIEEAAQLGPGVREYEPAGALFAGADGLDAYRSVLSLAARRLAPAGAAIFEIGAGQAAAVTALAASCGLHPAGQKIDLGDHIRALAFERS